ncbi:MAG: SBBP repeat-containing protein [Spirochaetales bacterium]
MKRLVVAFFVFVTLIFSGCSNFNLAGDVINPLAQDAGGEVISIPSIPGITPPAMGEAPITAITETAQYTGAVTWSPADTAFSASTTYTATITLTAKPGFTLTGLTAASFTIPGANTVTFDPATGVVTAVFPATGATPPTVISIAAIPGVTAPALGATPVTAITETAQYTGTVAWSGTPVSFSGSTAYTATISLTAKSGYTLTGIAADFFTVASATSDTNSAGSGVVTAVFAAIPTIETFLLGTVATDTNYSAVSVDSSGNRYVVGYTSGILGGQPSVSGTSDVVVAKYNASGTLQWTKLSGAADTGSSYGTAIAIDSSGNSYVTGNTTGNLDGQTYSGGIHAFIIKRDVDGVWQWTKLLGAVGGFSTRGKGIAVDPTGNIYVTGYTNRTMDAVPKIGDQDAFVTKYNAAGMRQWTKLIGVAASTIYGNALAVDTAGNSYIAGGSPVSIDGQSVTGARDVLVTKYDTAGVLKWTRLLGEAGADAQGLGITVDNSGFCYVTGATTGGLDGLPNTGTSDFLVAKFSDLGVKQWSRILGVAGAETWGYGIAVDTSGSSYVTGDTGGDLDGQTKPGSTGTYVTKYNATGTKQWTKLLGTANGVTLGQGIAIDSSGKVHVVGSMGGGGATTLDGQSLIGASDGFLTTRFNY